MDEQIKWSKWELVKVGKSTWMEKVSKSGSVPECVTELLKELGPLYRHIFNSEWQRDQFQRLKENLPDDWAIATMDFAEIFSASSRMNRRVPTGLTSRSWFFLSLHIPDALHAKS